MDPQTFSNTGGLWIAAVVVLGVAAFKGLGAIIKAYGEFRQDLNDVKNNLSDIKTKQATTEVVVTANSARLDSHGAEIRDILRNSPPPGQVTGSTTNILNAPDASITPPADTSTGDQ